MENPGRHELLLRIADLLVSAGPILQQHDMPLYLEAAVCHSRLADAGCSAPDAAQRFDALVDQRFGGAGGPHLPPFARGQYPFDKPTKTLREAMPAIEAMLAPLRNPKRCQRGPLKVRRDAA